MKIEAGGGPRSAQISRITIGNNTPYLRYLAGDPYDGSHKVWAGIKGGDPNFVRSGILPENRNWIGNQNRILKARLNKLVSGSVTPRNTWEQRNTRYSCEAVLSVTSNG